MEGRSERPKWNDSTPLALLCGAKRGVFWDNCKRFRRCRRPPYDRLLDNHVLRADYRFDAPARESNHQI